MRRPYLLGTATCKPRSWSAIFFLFPALRGSAFLFSPPPVAGGGQPSTDPFSHGAGQPSANVSVRYEQGRPTCGPQGVPHVATPESHAVGCAVPSGAQLASGFIFTPPLALHHLRSTWVDQATLACSSLTIQPFLPFERNAASCSLVPASTIPEADSVAARRSYFFFGDKPLAPWPTPFPLRNDTALNPRSSKETPARQATPSGCAQAVPPSRRCVPVDHPFAIP